jgi:hypothetical protein
MMVHHLEFLDPALARQGQIAAIAVTSTAGYVDLSTHGALGAAVIAGRLLRLTADGADVYFAFAADHATAIDDTNVDSTPGTDARCDVLPDTQSIVGRPPIGYPILHYKTASGATATLRISVASQNPQAYCA